MVLAGYSAEAQEPRQQRVLALYVTTPGAAGAAIFETVYQRKLSAALGNRLDFHGEFIDLARFRDSGYPVALAEFFKFKYTRLPPDLIIAPTEDARAFVERFRDHLFPGIPIVFVDRAMSKAPDPGTTGVSAPLDLGATLDLALSLQPEATQVFVVGGASEFDRTYERLARAQLPRFASRVTLTYLTRLPFAALKQKVAALPPNSIIYFLSFGEDGAGARFRSTEALDELGAVANAPIYGWNTVGMGHGIVGGRLYSNELVADRSAELTLRILHGEKPDDIPVITVDPNLTQLDWRQLRRWGLGTRAPRDATILFRELSLWDRYKVYIASALGLVLLQTALIGGLLLQRARRRRVEAALRENQADLQSSHQQITDLFGRLIAAQETERSRIARDLHDDVSQRVAGLSIMISGLKTRLRSGPPDDEVTRVLASMQRNTITLSEGIRQVSHDLHPSLLHHAGLVAAVNVFCDQFEKLHKIPVTYAPAPDLGRLDADVALSLYRITQEVLWNVAKHAGAGRVAVALNRTTDAIELVIADDGKGFDLAAARGRCAGLGLVSVDERVRLLQGQVHIDTQPGGGTRVHVRIPMPRRTPALRSRERRGGFPCARSR